ncbi:uncharacterized protein LOC106469705 [Limulus polyphemus]|uniref:Uncharacterized protein LOC106469705 n=1 Tax=Limulus polyphemus TaxID=6850 RepID=A0ABM1BNP0_LIMPO|nr:uncharacterized protein LOC106469705 [Limulus polyphemus]
MGISKKEAYEVLGLSSGGNVIFISTSFFGDNGYEMDDSVEDTWDDDSSVESEIEAVSHDLGHAIRLENNEKITATMMKTHVKDAYKIAEDLIAEEEKDRRKAEKRRAKKRYRECKVSITFFYYFLFCILLQRRNAKKKLEKELAQKSETNNQYGEDIKNKDDKRNYESSSSENEEEDLDPNSAFVAIAASKNRKANNSTQNKIKNKERPKPQTGVDEEKQNVTEIDPVVLQSRQLAIRGNEMASLGRYQEAIQLFTKATKLDPRDYRFFGNRSYCFDRLGDYKKALSDAEVAISLSPQWPKGYFRKGRALSGLKKYVEAEEAFEKVLKLDKDCSDAVEELQKVRSVQIIEMGFTEAQADSAISHYGTVQSALEALLSQSGGCINAATGGVDHEYEDLVLTTSKPVTNQTADEKMDPGNPNGFTSLWVGNVQKEVTDKMLLSFFSKYGTVSSIRILPERYCAFINYRDKQSAGKAMQFLQGKELCGQYLLIRFPDNPVTMGQPGVTVLKKSRTGSKPDTKRKVTGPVQDGECYFWRTTGCVFGSRCIHKHIKEHEGVDKKPWQA